MNRSMRTLPFALALLVGCAVAGTDGPENQSSQTPSQASALVAADNHEAEASFHLLTKLRLENGNTIEMYEPKAGHVVMAEEGAYPNAPVSRTHALDGLSPVEIYRVLAPNREVPAALIDAHARTVALSAYASTLPHAKARVTQSAMPAPDLSGMQTESAPCPALWFQQTFCGNADWMLCLTNHWNGAYAQGSDVWSLGTTVCPFSGSVTMKVTDSDGTGGIWTVNQGFYRNFSDIHTPGLFQTDFDFRVDVTNAIGKGFQFRADVFD